MSVVTFWASSVSSLVCAVIASNCLRARAVEGAVGIGTGDLDDLAVVVWGALRGRHGRTIPLTDMDIVYMT